MARMDGNAYTKTITVDEIMRSAAFVKGFNDKLKGKPFDYPSPPLRKDLKMGDHRISLKAQFEMHGHKAKIDQWVNHTPDYPDKIAEWLQEQIDIAMSKYLDKEWELQKRADAETEHQEREQLARLKKKYE